MNLRSALASFSDVAMEIAVAPSWSRLGFSARSHLEEWDHQPIPRMDGRVVVLTGFTSGIGLAAAEKLGELGATLHLVGRNPERVATIAEHLRAQGLEVCTSVADMGDLDAVRSIADEIIQIHGRVDVLVHNAGALSSTYTVSPQGLEMTVASQVVGPFLLTSLLLPILGTDQSPGRVITVASGGMYAERLDLDRLCMDAASYNGVRAYARAKRAQVELNEEWSARSSSSVVFHAMHPGWVDTPGVVTSLPMFYSVTRPVLRTPAEGADTIVWLAGAAITELGANGGFWLDRHRRSITKIPGTSASRGERDRLWRWCSETSGIMP
jgi:dehydrogenase/reductase SDR family member 12